MPVESREYSVTEEAVAQAKELGIGGEVAKRLARMAKRSAPLTHPEGNRRFDAFVLRVHDRKVLSINRL
jgi:hypothetical protein